MLIAAFDPWPILLTIIGLGGLIFFHELGHFLACRLTGTRVEAFSIGFGKEIIGWTRGHTRYKVSLIPLGGYVKMAAENPGEMNTGAPDEFPNKSFSARLFIMSNGVIFNIILAFFLYAIGFSIGVPFDAPEVGNVAQGGPAWDAGLVSGDRVTHINGEPIFSFVDIRQETALSSEGEVLNLTVERRGQTLEIPVTPRFNEGMGAPMIGIEPSVDDALAAPEEGSPAALAGGKEGDVVLAVNGKPILGPGEFLAAVLELSGHAPKDAETLDLAVRVRRAGGGEETLNIKAPIGNQPRIGIQPATGTTVAARITGFGVDAIQVGDVVKAVNGRAIADLTDLTSIVIDEPVREVLIERAGKAITVKPDRPVRVNELGRALRGKSSEDMTIAVRPGMAAERAGVLTGDRVTKVNGKAVEKWGAAVAAIVESKGAVKLDVERDGKPLSFSIEPGRQLRSMLGYAPRLKLETVQEKNLGKAIVLGYDRTVAMGKTVVLTVRSLLTARVSSDNIGGPLTLAVVTNKSAERGFGYYLFILALISVNLAILNLLPIPVLDGGQIVLLCAEKIRGKPLPERFVGYYQMIGVVLILGLIILALKNDVTNVFFR